MIVKDSNPAQLTARGLEPVFFEKIGDQKTSRDEILKNLIKALEKNGWTIKK